MPYGFSSPLTQCLLLLLAWGVLGVVGLVRPFSIVFVGRTLFPLGALVGLALAVVAATGLGHPPEQVELLFGLPDLPVHLRLDSLSAVFLVHTGGFALGYAATRAFHYDRIIARTISIEVGMQNSGLGVVLARRHFADPLTAVPCAISSVFHSVIGSLLAGYWRLRGNAPR